MEVKKGLITKWTMKFCLSRYMNYLNRDLEDKKDQLQIDDDLGNRLKITVSQRKSLDCIVCDVVYLCS